MTMDVIFLSSGEYNAESNFQRACEVLGLSPKRVTDATNILDGFKKASALSTSDHFILIDGDNYLLDNAAAVLKAKPVPTIFQADNLYGMKYGHGGIKILPRSFDWDSLPNNILDVSTYLNLQPMNETYSHHAFDWSVYSFYKTVFKELLKLHLRQENVSQNKIYLEKWLEREEVRDIFSDVKEFLSTAKFSSLTLEEINLWVKNRILEKSEVVLLGIMGNDKSWVSSYVDNMKYFDKGYVLDTFSTDGSYKELSSLAPENLHIGRKWFWSRDFSRFRNVGLEQAKAMLNLNAYSILVNIDLDERIEAMNKEELKREVLFSKHAGRRMSVKRKEWHGAITPIARVFMNANGNWHWPIHETFIYEELSNELNPVSSISLHHLKSEEKALKNKGKRDLKILKKVVGENPKRYLYFIFESLDKMKDYEELLKVYQEHKSQVETLLDYHYQLLIHKFVLNAQSRLAIEPFEESIQFMKKSVNKSVYFQLIKALQSFDVNLERCRELFQEMITLEKPKDFQSEVLYLQEAYDDSAISNLGKKLGVKKWK